MSERERPVPVVGHVGWSPDYDHDEDPPDFELWRCGSCHEWDYPPDHECRLDCEAEDA